MGGYGSKRFWALCSEISKVIFIIIHRHYYSYYSFATQVLFLLLLFLHWTNWLTKFTTAESLKSSTTSHVAGSEKVLGSISCGIYNWTLVSMVYVRWVRWRVLLMMWRQRLSVCVYLLKVALLVYMGQQTKESWDAGRWLYLADTIIQLIVRKPCCVAEMEGYWFLQTLRQNRVPTGKQVLLCFQA